MGHLSKDDLDEVSPHNPILFQHVSGHVIYVNTYALNLLTINRHTTSPKGGVIHKNKMGEPNGQLDETAMFLVMDKLPNLIPDNQHHQPCALWPNLQWLNETH